MRQRPKPVTCTLIRVQTSNLAIVKTDALGTVDKCLPLEGFEAESKVGHSDNRKRQLIVSTPKARKVETVRTKVNL